MIHSKISVSQIAGGMPELGFWSWALEFTRRWVG